MNLTIEVIKAFKVGRKLYESEEKAIVAVTEQRIVGAYDSVYPLDGLDGHDFIEALSNKKAFRDEIIQILKDQNEALAKLE